MTDYKQFFQEKLAELPDLIRDSIEYSDWENLTRKISERNKLHIDQGMILEESVAKLIVGIFDGPAFVKNMFENGHVSTAMAGDILLQVDKEIMTVIKEDIEYMENLKAKDTELERLIIGEEKALEKDLANLYAEYFTTLDFIDTEFKDENENSEETNNSGELDIEKERQEILAELEREDDYEDHYIKPDHQISNIHIEKPINIEIKKEEAPEVLIPISEKVSNKTEEVLPKPLNKNINFNDVYREPIE